MPSKSEIDIMWTIVNRAKELSDMKMEVLRIIFAGFGCDFPPNASEVKRVTKGLTRGQLIENILSAEFDKELTPEG